MVEKQNGTVKGSG